MMLKLRDKHMIEKIQYIYSKLGDALSREIYMDRLCYSITHDNRYLEDMIGRTVRNQEEWKGFCQSLRVKAVDSKMYLFGAGVWGTMLYNETKKFLQWQGVLDNHPMGKTLGNLSIYSLEQFIDVYDDDAVIIITSYKNSAEMFTQLQEIGISRKQILDAGSIIYKLTEGAIYFDLEELNPQKQYEIFVDAGGFDGLTTKGFLNWCNRKGYSYCFEADNTNLLSVEYRLTEDMEYCEIVPKAVWSQSCYLSMCMKGNCASAVIKDSGSNNIQRVEAVALDDYLGDKPVTYIKMDVEGAELEVIKGAKNIIMRQHPRLAVSIYHKIEDIWEIPTLILEYYSGYQLYLRHYSFSYYDTVLYAIP